MDFNDSPQEAAFRAEVRAWLDANARRLGPQEKATGTVASMLAEGSADTPAQVERAQAWQRTLAAGGWAGLTWPQAYGGRDLGPVEVVIFSEESAHYDIPPNLFGIGLGMIGPTLIAHGTEEQKQRYLPPMLRGDEIWCQLWSEPNAGSDIAALQTRAVRDGAGDWVLNGQKVWTSGAHYAHRGLIIARTDPDAPKHRGITCFIVDMSASGIEPRPLRQMTGGANFNEVFLTDVRIPDDQRVGDIGDGWRVALTVLMNERSSVAGGLNLASLVDPLVALARERAAISDSHVRQTVADVYIRAKLLTLTADRALTKLGKGSIPGPEGSIAKLVWSDLMTDIGRSGIGLLGLAGCLIGDDAPDRGMWTSTHLIAPGIHLGGGTDEVMRNIIGERVLGLPKEPSADKGIPFRELLIGTQR